MPDDFQHLMASIPTGFNTAELVLSYLILVNSEKRSMGLAMQVVAAGSPQQVADAMRDAEQYKEPLMERGVLVVPLPIYEGDAAAPRA